MDHTSQRAGPVYTFPMHPGDLPRPAIRSCSVEDLRFFREHRLVRRAGRARLGPRAVTPMVGFCPAETHHV